MFDSLLAPTYLAAASAGHTRLVDSRYVADCCIAREPMRMGCSSGRLFYDVI